MGGFAQSNFSLCSILTAGQDVGHAPVNAYPDGKSL
jgi:hypothetical protein